MRHSLVKLPRHRVALLLVVGILPLCFWSAVALKAEKPEEPVVAPLDWMDGDLAPAQPAQRAAALEQTAGTEVEACWNILRIGAPAAWAGDPASGILGVRGAGIKVAIIGTGCDLDNPDLKDNIITSANFVRKSQPAEDFYGLGTATASIVAARENDSGVVGVAPDAGLMIAKALGDDGSGRDANIAAAIDWATQNGADVVLLNYTGATPLAKAAIQRAYAAGVVLAAGPYDWISPSMNEPASLPEVTGVQAVKQVADSTTYANGPDPGALPTDSLFGFEPWRKPLTGPVELVGPGFHVPVDWLNLAGGYDTSTAIAAANVAGTAALVIEQLGNLGCRRVDFPDRSKFSKLVQLILTDSAEQLWYDDADITPYPILYPRGHQGSGLVRADAAVALDAPAVAGYLDAIENTHDIAVTGISGLPTQTTPGTPYTVTVTVKNNATDGWSPGVTAALYQASASSWTQVGVAPVTFTAATGTATIAWTAPAALGAYTLYAEAVVDGADIDATNNALTRNVQVANPPLVVNVWTSDTSGPNATLKTSFKPNSPVFVNVMVYSDQQKTAPFNGASVSVTITSPQGGTAVLSATSGADGCAWVQYASTAKTGTYQVNAQASASGYTTGSATTSFRVAR
jgi:hypothetical protein